MNSTNKNKIVFAISALKRDEHRPTKLLHAFPSVFTELLIPLIQEICDFILLER